MGELMDDFTPKELETVRDYLTTRLIEMEYTSVSHENELIMRVFQTEVHAIEERLEQEEN
jgi:hypothetical protein